MTAPSWHVHKEYAGEQFVGYVLKNSAGEYYRNEDGAITWREQAKAEVDCALINAGVEL